jgi:hypothetical protein
MPYMPYTTAFSSTVVYGASGGKPKAPGARDVLGVESGPDELQPLAKEGLGDPASLAPPGGDHPPRCPSPIGRLPEPRDSYDIVYGRSSQKDMCDRLRDEEFPTGGQSRWGSKPNRGGRGGQAVKTSGDRKRAEGRSSSLGSPRGTHARTSGIEGEAPGVLDRGRRLTRLWAEGAYELFFRQNPHDTDRES